MNPFQIFEALEARWIGLGLSQAEICIGGFGKSDNSAFQTLRRASSPSTDTLAVRCSAAGWEFYFGHRRESASITQVTVDGTDFVSIVLRKASLAAGAKIANGCYNVTDRLAFRRDWLTRVGESAERACLAWLTGHSMFPTLSPKDLALIDTRHKEPPILACGDKDKRRSSF